MGGWGAVTFDELGWEWGERRGGECVVVGLGRFGEAGEEFAAEVHVHGVFVALALHGGEGVEEQLGDVGEGDGVAAGDTFAGELLNEIAEEAIDGIGLGEVADVAEEFGGEGFGVGRGLDRLGSSRGRRRRRRLSNYLRLYHQL